MKFLWTYAALVFLAGCATVEPKPTLVTAPEFSGKRIASFAAPHTNGVLYDGPCQHGGVLAAVPAPYRHEMKSATGTYEGKPYGVCWTWNVDESAAVIVWEDGGVFSVPRQLLKVPVGV